MTSPVSDAMIEAGNKALMAGKNTAQIYLAMKAVEQSPDCAECKGTGTAEMIGGYPRPCDACHGKGIISDHSPDDVERVARAMKPALFEGGPDETRGPVTQYERNVARDMARAAIAAIRGQLSTVDGGWQPIETAPLDGTKIDLWVEREGKVPLRIPHAYFHDGRWLHSYNGMRLWHEPTHWRPFPKGPAIRNGDGG